MAEWIGSLTTVILPLGLLAIAVIEFRRQKRKRSAWQDEDHTQQQDELIKPLDGDVKSREARPTE